MAASDDVPGGNEAIRVLKESAKGLEVDRVELDGLSNERLPELTRGMQEAAAAVGADPANLSELVKPKAGEKDTLGSFLREHSLVPPEGRHHWPIFPEAKIEQKEIALGFCLKVAPFDRSWMFRIPHGPGGFDTIVYPVIYNLVENFQLLLIHSHQGVIFNQKISRPHPRVKWLSRSEKYGYEYEMEIIARRYIRWLNTNACKE